MTTTKPDLARLSIRAKSADVVAVDSDDALWLVARARDAERQDRALTYARRQLASSPGACAEIDRIVGGSHG